MGTIESFLATTDREIHDSLAAHHLRCMLEEASNGQHRAWADSVKHLKSALLELVGSRPEAGAWAIVLEFELPRERGRRPDAVILAPGRLIVLEFKGYRVTLPEYVDQVSAYARDLAEYHAASHDLTAIPVLVLQSRVREPLDGRAHVVAAEELGALLIDQLEICSGAAPDPYAWVEADYSPLPTLVAAARTIFKHEPLRSIRAARSAGIPEALAYLTAAANRASEQSERHLALITGVPGAGKTLVGLQFVYASHFGEGDTAKQAVFLSGNGPLVKVLQHALRSRVFVQDVHGFLKQHGGHDGTLPPEHIWVYDEAQRAWDAGRVQEKRGHGFSEPEDFLRLGARTPGWAMVVGLIGEGQEIHLGEESGLGQWNDAVATSDVSWTVHCPPRLSGVFSAADSVSETGLLDLTVSLRSHLASDVQDWVRELLNGRLDQAHTAAIRAQQAGYDMYLTDSLERAKEYVRGRYAGMVESRYGLLASSKAKDLESMGVHNSYAYTKRFREGPWFNDEPDDDDSCCQLRETATEFQCQGLELDCPIVCWGDDLWWTGSEWASRPSPRSRARDPHRLRLNSYRVLLSRGRDGVVLFCPPTMNPATRTALSYAGLLPLR